MRNAHALLDAMGETGNACISSGEELADIMGLAAAMDASIQGRRPVVRHVPAAVLDSLPA
ncbi:MAG: hypothetical protein KDI46_02005 [Alphaproteobacteria bacterium]|nr:hypothetical protein [Alphaproteobacteria bacterium]